MLGDPLLPCLALGTPSALPLPWAVLASLLSHLLERAVGRVITLKSGSPRERTGKEDLWTHPIGGIMRDPSGEPPGPIHIPFLVLDSSAC